MTVTAENAAIQVDDVKSYEAMASSSVAANSTVSCDGDGSASAQGDMSSAADTHLHQTETNSKTSPLLTMHQQPTPSGTPPVPNAVLQPQLSMTPAIVQQHHHAVREMVSVLAGMPGFNIPGMPGSQKAAQSDSPDPSIAPNRTLYINNLNDRIKTDKLETELRAMFANFGEVLQVVAMKSFWRRGQAWIIFAEQESASNAMTHLQGLLFHHKPMRINYAIGQSDIFTKADGTFVERPKGPRRPRAIIEREALLQMQLQNAMLLEHQPGGAPPLELFTSHAAQHQQQAQTEDGRGGVQMTPGGPGLSGMTATPMPPGLLPHLGASMVDASNHATGSSFESSTTAPGGVAVGAGHFDKNAVVAAAAAQAAEALQSTRKRRFGLPAVGSSTTPTRPDGMFPFPMSTSGWSMGSTQPSRPALPNETLFAEDLPEDCTQAALHSVFSRFPGFVEVRHIGARRVAFIEFETQACAAAAMTGVQSYEFVPGVPLRINYAKR